MLHALTSAATAWRVAGERNLGLIAAGVGFFAMLAIFPALAALIALVAFWADPAIVEEALDLLAEFLPPDAFDLIADQIERLSATASPGLGLASAVSFLAAVWSARLGVGALVQGLNAIYGGRSRGSVRDIATALTLTAVLILVGVVAVVAMLFAPLTLALAAPFLPADSVVPVVAEALRWLISLGALTIGLGLFFRYGPNRPERRRSAFLSPGLALTLVLWSAASVGFTVFLNNFGNYNEVYGSIGAVIALLMWLYISAYSVLLGAALNYVLEKEKAGERPPPDPSF